MDKLLPCPFCGGEAIWECTGPHYYQIKCECGCCDIGSEKKQLAITKWNTRSNPTVSKERKDEDTQS